MKTKKIENFDLSAPIDEESVKFDDLTIINNSEEIKSSEVDVKKIKKRSIWGAMSYFGTTLGLNLVALLANFLLMAFLNPEDFGVYGFVVQINAILVFFSDVGLASSLIQKKGDPDESDYQTVFWTQQILSWVIFLVAGLIALSGIVTDKTGSAGNWILMALAISFPLATMKTVSSIKLSRKMEFHKMVIPQIFEQIIYNVVLIYLAWRGWGAISYAVAIVIKGVVGVIAMSIILPFKPKFLFSKTSFRDTIKFGLKFQANDLLARIKDNLFYLVVGWNLPSSEFGFISWAKNWSMYPYNLTVQNIMNITFPTFSRLQDHKDLLKKAVEKSIFFITVVIFPILAGMVTLIGPLINVVPQYAKWEPAIPSFVLFTLAIGWSAISSPLTNTLNATGKINKTLKLMVFWTILTWVLTFPMMWKFGYNGVAIASFMIAWTSFLPILMVKKFLKFKLWDNVWRQLVSALIMGVIIYLTSEMWSKGWLWLIMGGLLAVGIYGIMMMILGWKKIWMEIRSLRS